MSSSAPLASWLLLALTVAAVDVSAHELVDDEPPEGDDGAEQDAASLSATSVASTLDRPSLFPLEYLKLQDMLRIGFEMRAAASFDKGGAAISFGPRWMPVRWLVLGADLEWNPWLDGISLSARPGTLNIDAYVGFKWINLAPVAVKSTVRAGTSLLLFDLVRSPKYSIGPLVTVVPLGLSIAVTDWLFVEIDPAELAVIVPGAVGSTEMVRQLRVAGGITIVR